MREDMGEEMEEDAQEEENREKETGGKRERRLNKGEPEKRGRRGGN
jgi:hypothetical protein